MGTWDDATLCTQEDAESEIGSLTTILQVRDTDRPALISRALTATKKEFGELIMSHLPDIYARYPYQNWPYNAWVQFMGYSYTQTDELLDLIRPKVEEEGVITFPEITTTAVAMFIKRCLIIQVTQFKAAAGMVNPVLESMMHYWTDESKERWKLAQRRLFIDFAKNDQVIDSERLRMYRGFQRG